MKDDIGNSNDKFQNASQQKSQFYVSLENVSHFLRNNISTVQVNG